MSRLSVKSFNGYFSRTSYLKLRPRFSSNSQPDLPGSGYTLPRLPKGVRRTGHINYVSQNSVSTQVNWASVLTWCAGGAVVLALLMPALSNGSRTKAQNKQAIILEKTGVHVPLCQSGLNEICIPESSCTSVGLQPSSDVSLVKHDGGQLIIKNLCRQP